MFRNAFRINVLHFCERRPRGRGEAGRSKQIWKHLGFFYWSPIYKTCFGHFCVGKPTESGARWWLGLPWRRFQGLVRLQWMDNLVSLALMDNQLAFELNGLFDTSSVEQGAQYIILIFIMMYWGLCSTYDEHFKVQGPSQPSDIQTSKAKSLKKSQGFKGHSCQPSFIMFL